MNTRNNKLKIALLDRLSSLYDESLDLTFKERPFLSLTLDERNAHPELMVINEMPEERLRIGKQIKEVTEKLNNL